MSGSAFLVWLEYRPEEVKLNLRELKHYSRKGASGNRVNFFFVERAEVRFAEPWKAVLHYF